MGKHELEGLRLMCAQIGFEKDHLGGGKLIRTAVIENGEVRLFIIEAVMGRMAGVFAKKIF